MLCHLIGVILSRLFLSHFVSCHRCCLVSSRHMDISSHVIGVVLSRLFSCLLFIGVVLSCLVSSHPVSSHRCCLIPFHGCHIILSHIRAVWCVISCVVHRTRVNAVVSCRLIMSLIEHAVWVTRCRVVRCYVLLSHTVSSMVWCGVMRSRSSHHCCVLCVYVYVVSPHLISCLDISSGQLQCSGSVRFDHCVWNRRTREHRRGEDTERNHYTKHNHHTDHLHRRINAHIGSNRNNR